MDNSGNCENYNLSRQLDRTNSSVEPVDSDFVYDNYEVLSQDDSRNYEALSHDRSDHKATSNDRSESNEALAHCRSEQNKAASHDSSDQNKTTSRDWSDQNMTSSHGRSEVYKVMNPHVTSQSNRSKDISHWIRSYKLLIGITGGCLLTIIIVVPTVYFATKSRYETNNLSESVTDNHFPLKFDQSTLYNSAFLSEDGLTLSNKYSRDTPVSSVNNMNTLSEYRGVIGNRCFERKSKIYFEVKYEFNVIGNLNLRNLIFEVGLAERERVDNYHYVGENSTKGWSYHLYICSETNNNTCLTAQHNISDVFTEFPWHQSSQGSRHSGKLGFIFNTNLKTFSIARNQSDGTQIIHSFQNVYPTQKLCPVFGVFNPNYFAVKLTLSNTFDFSKNVWNTVII